MSKLNMEDDTFQLLIDHLNGPSKSFPGRFKVAHDPTITINDVPMLPSAQYLRTIVIETYPSETRISSAASSKSKKHSNSYAVVRMPDGNEEPVHILWIFEKRIQLQGPGIGSTMQRYMHVRKLKVVSTEEAMGNTVPCGELLARMRISFALRSEDGEEMVLPIEAFVSQLVVAPIQPQKYKPNHVYGLKAL